MNTENTIQAIHIAPARFVTVALAAQCTGLTQSAIRTKMSRGVWVEGREYVRHKDQVFIDLRGYEKWVSQAA